jgi:single-strand DNA-binding protein
MDNSITIVGNLTRDPEIRFTANGTAMATLGVAVNRRWRGNDGEFQEQTSFFDCVLWRELAENAGDSLSKGDRVIITGRLEQRSWDTPEGEKRYKIEIIADEVGPSIRWATASVTRNAKREGPGGGGGGRPDGPPMPSEPPSYSSDEEPF